jgi:light-regulated signal transduction histidine kinase (bacteriophytochrome)
VNGIRTHTDTADPEIKISDVSEGDYRKFAVRNNGMKTEKQFDLFEKLKIKDILSGTGMGLNGPGKVAVFHFILPAADI